MDGEFPGRNGERHLLGKPVDPLVRGGQLSHEGRLRPQQVEPLVRDDRWKGAAPDAARILGTGG